MKLIGSLTSPYVRKVRVALAEKKLPYEFVDDSPWAATTGVPAYNPLGKVPALVADDGATLFDSNVLLDYLELVAPNPPLLQREPRAALQQKQQIALIDGLLEAGIAILLEGRRPPQKQHPDWVARQRGKIERGLAELERQAQGLQWLQAGTFGAADIAAGCLLLWLDFRLPEYDWRAGHPALAALAARLEQRPSFAQTVPVE